MSGLRPLYPADPPAAGPFALLARLGAGAMGTVFLARSAGGRPVAVKLVHPGLAADQDFRARFRREVAAARRVGGFWTAAVVDADVSATTPWLATEYVPGPTLAEAVAAAGPLPEPALRVLAAGLAEALAAIHELGLVHRDVKPSNVLLAAGGPRLIDFGIARALEHTAITAAGMVFGTPGYMAPEQAAGAEPGPPSDVYSLGAVLVYAATGAGPLGAGTPVTLMARAAAGRASAGTTPASLHGLVSACLATDPRARPRPRDIITAAAAGGLPDTGGWLPAGVQTMAETLAAAPSATSVLTAATAAGRPGPRPAGYPPVPGQPSGYPPVPGQRSGYPPVPAPPGAPTGQPAPFRLAPGLAPGQRDGPADGTGGAVFVASRGWAALRGGLCAAGLVVAEGLSRGGPAARLAGLVLLVWTLAAGIGVLAGAVSLPRRVAVGPAGVTIVRSRSQVRLPWSGIARIGVAGGRRPWLVAWPQSPAGDQLLSESFRAYHGGYRLQRVAPWRSRRAGTAEASALCAALAWHAGPRFDPRLAPPPLG